MTSSDSDDFREFFRSSSDRSSVGSIPWAQDAIEENRLCWEHVERMFYGEEELPDEPNLRREILEWNKAFPHLRVKGEQINRSSQKRRSSTPGTKEEIILIHPNKSTFINTGKSGEICKNTTTRSAAIFTEPVSLEEYLEKDLQIRSVSMLTKKSYSVPKIAPTEVIPNSRFNTVQSSTFRQSIWKSSGSLLLRRSVPVNKVSNSAKIIRIPPIIIVPSQIQQNSATIRRNLKSTIILPPINVNRVELSPLDSTSRSANTAHQKSTSQFPFSASKWKYPK